MENTEELLQMIKKSVLAIDPLAKLILYGSYARGDHRQDSDIDLLILINKEDRVTYADRYKITTPIHDLELKTGSIISAIVRTKKDWANHMITPFYENVNREGKVL